MAMTPLEDGAADASASLVRHLNALEGILDDDPEVFAEAVRLLSTGEGELIVEAARATEAALAAAHQAARTETCEVLADGQAFVRHAAVLARAHSIDAVALTSIDPWASPETLGGDDGLRPTYKALHWHAHAGRELQLLPATVLRDAFVLVLSGTASVTLDGGSPLRLRADEVQAEGALIKGVNTDPFLPEVRLEAADGEAFGLLFLLCEAGVPLVQPPGVVGAPVRLAACEDPRRLEAFWTAMRQRRLGGPIPFAIPRGQDAFGWAEALPLVQDGAYPHLRAVSEQQLLPREDPAWRDERLEFGPQGAPRLIYRVIQLPELTGEANLELAKHAGVETILCWAGRLQACLDSKLDDRVQVSVAELAAEGRAPVRAEVQAHEGGLLDILGLQSDHLRHNLSAVDGPAVALLFSAPKYAWTRRWQALCDPRSLTVDQRGGGHGRR